MSRRTLREIAAQVRIYAEGAPDDWRLEWNAVAAEVEAWAVDCDHLANIDLSMELGPDKANCKTCQHEYASDKLPPCSDCVSKKIIFPFWQPKQPASPEASS